MKARVVRVRHGRFPGSRILSGQGTNFEILRALVHAVQASGGGDRNVRRIVKDEVLARRVGEAFMGDKVLDVTVDLGLSFEEAIRQSGFHNTDPEVTADHFYGRERPSAVLTYGLTFIRSRSCEEALGKMKIRSFKPADSAQLFAWGAQFRSHGSVVVQHLPVVALGNLWQDQHGMASYGLCVSTEGELQMYNTANTHAHTINFLAEYDWYDAKD